MKKDVVYKNTTSFHSQQHSVINKQTADTTCDPPGLNIMYIRFHI